MKLKSLYKAKDMVNRTKLQPTKWEKDFIKCTYNRGLKYKIYKELKNYIWKNQTT